MSQIFQINWIKTKYSIIFGLIVVALLLVTVAYKNDVKVQKTPTDVSLEIKELEAIKKFLIPMYI